jgi:hypothetical protein
LPAALGDLLLDALQSVPPNVMPCSRAISLMRFWQVSMASAACLMV